MRPGPLYPGMATNTLAHGVLGLTLLGTGCLADNAELAEAEHGAEVVRAPDAPLRFLGRTSDWFDPANWDGRRVPGPGDDVLVDGSASAVIDPARNPDTSTPDPGRVVVGDITVAGQARLETLAGSELQFGALDVQQGATAFAASSAWLGTTLQVHGDCSNWRCGYNPSAVEVDTYALTGDTVAFHLGGLRPAARDATGPGYHATVRANTVALSGTALLVGFRYGFVPRPGDRFVIVAAREALTGTFANAAHGAEVARTGNVALVIRYEQNQIVLVAEAR